jgi:outer membrane protein TolC
MYKQIIAFVFVLNGLSFSLIGQNNDSIKVLTLKEALEIAKENYPSIRLKRAGKEASLYDLKSAQNNYLPGFIVQGQILNGTSNQVRGPYYSNEGMAIPISSGLKPNGYTGTSTWTSFATGFVNWKFFNFGKYKTQVDAARAGTMAAESDYQNEVFQQQIKVGDAYLLSLMSSDMLKSQRANLARVKALKDVTSAYTKSGLKPGVDSSLVNAEYSKATLQFLEIERLSREQEVYLMELMGLKPNTAVLLDSTIYLLSQPKSFEPPREYNNNPRLIYFKSIIDLNEAKIRAVRRREYPSISMIAGSWARGSGIADQPLPNGDLKYDKSFSSGVGFRPYLDWMVGVSTIWNITNLFKTGNESKAQRQITVMAQERYNEETLRVESELERARLRYNAALEAARQAPIQLKAAQDAYAQARARYDAGLTSILELTQTFALLNRAEVDASMARGNVWRAVIQFAAASGNMSIFTTNLN